MKIQDQLKAFELKLVASRKEVSDQLRELEALKAKAANPAPAARRDLKSKRIQSIANFYANRKLKSA